MVILPKEQEDFVPFFKITFQVEKLSLPVFHYFSYDEDSRCNQKFQHYIWILIKNSLEINEYNII